MNTEITHYLITMGDSHAKVGKELAGKSALQNHGKLKRNERGQT